MDDPSDYERETIRLALGGDDAAGREALRLCSTGLLHGDISPALSHYLVLRLDAILDGEPPARALCVEIERGPGRPKNPHPPWKRELAAYDILLNRRGIKIEERNARMIDVHRMDRKDAYQIREAYACMEDLDDELLLHFAGPKMRKILGD